MTSNRERSPPYSPPSTFFHEFRDPNDRRMSCDRTRISICLFIVGLCIGAGFLIRYLADHWGSLRDIS